MPIPATDAFSIARELFADVDPTPDQIAQLRALDRKFYQEIYTLLHSRGVEGPPAGEGVEAEGSWTRRELTEKEAAALRERLIADVREVLSPGDAPR